MCEGWKIRDNSLCIVCIKSWPYYGCIAIPCNHSMANFFGNNGHITWRHVYVTPFSRCFFQYMMLTSKQGLITVCNILFHMSAVFFSISFYFFSLYPTKKNREMFTLIFSVLISCTKYVLDHIVRVFTNSQYFYTIIPVTKLTPIHNLTNHSSDRL